MSDFNPKTIVVPVDFSGETAQAIDVAKDIAEDLSQIHLIHVLLPLDAVSPGVLWGDLTDDQRKESVQKHMDELIAKGGLEGINTKIAFGNPGHIIPEYAKEISSELIVIPSHGYHGVKHFVMGSVAERVIRHAECAVLVLRRSDAD